MDIFKFAMEKERFSEEYYRDLATRANHVGLRNILTMLADEEAKHYRTIERIRTETPERVTDVPVLDRAREVFEQMRGAPKKFNFGISEAELYRKACRIEEQSKKFYLERAEEAEDPEQERVFRLLAAEEDKHLSLWRISACSYPSRRPSWKTPRCTTSMTTSKAYCSCGRALFPDPLPGGSGWPRGSG